MSVHTLPEWSRPGLVVGIGASAGGIAALQQFFRHLDIGIDAAYVVILHLSPDHESLLPEVVQAVTPMPVQQVTEEVRLQARHVYVVSPTHRMTARDGILQVSPLTRLDQRRSSVDIFFRALADAYASRAVAVVLSGTGPDGSNGLKRIKENGGLTLVQDPAEAEYPDMPHHAIATGVVDQVCPVAEMWPRLDAYGRQLDEVAAPADGLADGREPIGMALQLLRAHTGHDFSSYKPATVQRRITRRMTILGLLSVDDYLPILRDQPGEATALLKELLVSVTHFFRDPEAFAVLEQRVLPRIFGRRGLAGQVRAWVAGCATGEEAYSIAMLLAEASAASVDNPAVQVFATDLDHRAIGVARAGLYSSADIADVSDERVQRFFNRTPAGYRIRRELRETVLFAEHNLIKDPPFSHIDLVSCRNVLIYLNRTSQERVIETFHFALRPGGHLFLGASETPESSTDLFSTIDKNAHVYQNRRSTSRAVMPPSHHVDRPAPRAERLSASRLADSALPADLHQRLLEQYASPSVVVDDEHKVLHVSESAATYLQVNAGEPSRDLMMLLRPELRGDVRGALHQAARQRASIEVRGVDVDGPTPRRVDVTVRPVLRDGEAVRGLFLILFAESATAAMPQPANPPVSGDDRGGHLEAEITRLRGQLRATVEHYETQVEEARASNEELQAMNEELRSAAEELETSKEELQSVNEELTTVNQELRVKIDELALTSNNYQNLINATDVGTIFLDRSLRVQMSTPLARQVFNLRASDIGRPLTDLTSSLRYADLHDDIRRVLDHLQPLEREVKTVQGRWLLMRVLPYRTVDDRIDGVVLTFLDVTERRSIALTMRGSEERFRLLIDGAVDYAIFTMTFDGVIDSWNPGAERMFGYPAHEAVGQAFAVLFTPEDRAAGVPEMELEVAAREGRAEDERWHLRKDGTRLYCTGVTSRLGGSAPIGLAKIARDLTAQRQVQHDIEQANATLDRRVQERTSELQAEVSKHTAAEQHVLRLLHKLVTSQEDQRARIARDLHDHLGQQLTALRLTLERHRDRCAPGDRDDIERALAQAKTLDQEVDFLAWELRPAVLDDLGLAVALPRYVTEWSVHYGVAVECRTTGFRRGDLSPEAEVTFYRVAQEALNNVLKHAHATQVNVILERRDGRVQLAVEDDGIGFEPEQPHEGGLGVVSMRERAALIGGTFEIESVPAKGTTIFLRCPAARPANQRG